MKRNKMKPRNPITRMMLQTKRNSVHQKSKKAIRRKEKVELKKVSYSERFYQLGLGSDHPRQPLPI